MSKRLLRLLPTALLALSLAGPAFAQTTGTIIGVVTDASTGKPVAGALVVATSPNLQGEQTVVTDNGGNFRVTLLPPGQYKLAAQLEGFKPAERSDVRVSADKTIRANLAVVPEAVQLEEQVVRTGTAPVVNIGAAESGAVVSREFVASVPVGRSVEQVTAVVPTASTDFYGVGFAGAQSPENAYIVDGLNVTDPVYGTSTPNAQAQTIQPTLLTNFVQEIDVKTGNFMAEYGRATGGIVNVVTESGSNELHGSVFSNYTPRLLVQPTGETAGAAGEAVAWRFKPDEGAYDLDVGFEVGGPIMKDKLWFYAGFSPIVTKKTTERFLRTNVLASEMADPSQCVGQDPGGYGRCILSDGTYVQNTAAGSSEIVETGRTTYQAVGKLTYLLNEDNNLTVSAFVMPSKTKNYSMNSADTRRILEVDDSIIDVIGRYAGKFLDKRLIVEVVGGYHNASTVDQPTDFQRNTSTLRYEEDTELWALGETVAGCDSTSPDGRCPVFNYMLGGSGYLNDQRASRLAGKVAASYLFDAYGSHNAKVGIDVERSTYEIDKDYGGNAFFSMRPSLSRIRAFRSYGYPANPFNTPFGPATANEADVVVVDAIKNESYTTSTAIYLQDSWQLPVANLTLNAGIRWEAQSMNNSTTDIEGFSITNNWAPRIQGIWDFTGNGRGKVAASWGRFFYMIPLDMGDRAFGNETQVRYQLDNTTCAAGWDATNPYLDPTTISQSQCGLETRATDPVSGTDLYGIQVSGTTPVHPDLQGVYVDQFGAQAEYELLADLSVGVEYNGRRQGQAIEDMSPDDGGHYYIGNPGYGDDFEVADDGHTVIGTGCSDLARTEGRCLSPKGVETFDVATGRTIQIAFPKPERSYDGLTFFMRKNFSRNWQAAASYTYSYLRGNLAGPFRTEDTQLDPGITSEYDLASLMANRYGYLPGDQPHQFKLFGSYTFNFGPRFNVNVGAAYTGRSGQPVSALGAHPDYGDAQAFLLPRGMGGRSEFRNQVDLSAGLEYVLKAPYAIKFSVALFNLFNSQAIEIVDENYTYDTVQPVAGINCETDAASAGNPVQALLQDCPDLQFMKTVDGRPVTINPNWGRAFPGVASFQVPLFLRFGLALTF